uniref:hypothetical protein n=1 Tax=Candidatus Electrothrix sp. TaxID=2170559 RepID=UPI004055B5AA
MHELFEELKNIRKHYAAAQYPKAYHELHSLCRDYPECAEFSSAADSILSRYSDLEQSS